MDDDDDQRILDLLRALDQLPGPAHLEFPDGFDPARAESRMGRLVERLSADFSQPCTPHVAQDAGYYFGVDIPAAATEAGTPLQIRLSNYGDLAAVAVVTLRDPDASDHAGAGGSPSESDRRRIEAALSDLNYIVVPERLLGRRYDGVTHLADFYPGLDRDGSPYDDRPTWRTRFFDYL